MNNKELNYLLLLVISITILISNSNCQFMESAFGGLGGDLSGALDKMLENHFKNLTKSDEIYFFNDQIKKELDSKLKRNNKLKNTKNDEKIEKIEKNSNKTNKNSTNNSKKSNISSTKNTTKKSKKNKTLKNNSVNNLSKRLNKSTINNQTKANNISYKVNKSNSMANSSLSLSQLKISSNKTSMKNSSVNSTHMHIVKRTFDTKLVSLRSQSNNSGYVSILNLFCIIIAILTLF